MPSGSWSIDTTSDAMCLRVRRGKKGKRQELWQILERNLTAGRGRPGCPLYRLLYSGLAVTLDSTLAELGEVRKSFRPILTVKGVTFERTEGLL